MEFGCDPGKLKSLMAPSVRIEVPLEFRLWFTASRLGGPCLTLRDKCMEYIYREYKDRRLQITPAVILYVMNEGDLIASRLRPEQTREEQQRASIKHSALPDFVAACVARADYRVEPEWEGGVSWSELVQRSPTFRAILVYSNTLNMEQRFAMLRGLDYYLCKAGDVDL
jgi:hypothetical protein